MGTSLAIWGGRVDELFIANVPSRNLALVIYTVSALRNAGVGRERKLREIKSGMLRRMLTVCLGEIIRWSETGEAVVLPYQYEILSKKKPSTKYGFPQMVGIHRSPFPFQDAMGSGASRTTVNLRALKKDDSAWREAVEVQKGMNKNLAAFFRELQEFYGSEPGVAFQAVIWGGAGNVLRRKRRAANALARASEVLSPEQVDRMRIAQLRHLSENTVSTHPRVGSIIERFVEEGPNYLQIGGQYLSIWNIVLENGWQLASLMELPVAKTIQVENVGDKVKYVRVQVSAVTDSLAELDQLDATLKMLCKEAERLNLWEPFGAGLVEALLASLAGSPQEIRSPSFSIPSDEFTVPIGDKVTDFFSMVGHTANEKDEGIAGDVAYGRAISPNRFDNHTLTFSKEVFRVVAVVGPTNAGKTVKAWEMATQAAGKQAPGGNLIFVHHSTTEDEFAGKLAKSWGGTYLNVDLPIVSTETEYRRFAAEIKADIVSRLHRWDLEWAEAEMPFHLPLVVRVREGTEALATFYKRITRQEILKLIRKYFDKYGWWFGLCDDDLAALPPKGVTHEELGEIPANEGNALRSDVKIGITQLRKIGVALYVLTIQNYTSFDVYGEDTWGMIPKAFLLNPGSHDVGAVVRPSEMPEKLEFDFEEAAAMVIQGNAVKFPTGFVKPYLFNPWLPDAILHQQMGVR